MATEVGTTAVWIGLGAIAGACCRHYLSTVLTLKLSVRRPFPYGTLAVNLVGAFLIGAISLPLRSSSHPYLSLLLITGFLGSFTTFSTYILDTSSLWSMGDRRSAIGYWIASPILGFLCLELGMVLARSLF